MAEQVAEEDEDLRLLDVLETQLEAEVGLPPHGADRDGGDGRDPIAAIEMVNDRRLSHRSPGLCGGGHQAGFVGRKAQPAAPSSGGLPGENRIRRPFVPPALLIPRLRITELAEQPTRLATSFSERPSSRGANARRRRSYGSSSEPPSRIAASRLESHHSLCSFR